MATGLRKIVLHYVVKNSIGRAATHQMGLGKTPALLCTMLAPQLRTFTNHWRTVRPRSALAANQYEEAVSEVDMTPPTAMTHVEANPELQMVITDWHDGGKLLFPFSWLRDCCQCPKCFCQNSQSRKSAIQNLDPDIQPVEVQVDQTGQQLTIKWEDGHISEYDSTFLQQQQFTNEGRKGRLEKLQSTPKLWGSELLTDLPVVNYKELMEDETLMYNWLTNFEELGIQIIKGAKDLNDLPNLVNKTAQIRTTKYGEIMTLKISKNPISIAFTNLPVSLHNDFTFMENPPGVFFLNCISQGIESGGKNLFVDGFKVAKLLKEESPQHFETLTSQDVDFCDICNGDDPFIYTARKKIIELNDDKEVKRVTFSDHGRNLDLNMDARDVKPLYDAMKSLVNLFNDPKNILKFQMDEGDIVCMDNRRILHGREGFSMKGQRHLQGIYANWDEMRSRKEVLERKIHP